MNRKKFPHAGLVEVVVIGAICILIAGIALTTGDSGAPVGAAQPATKAPEATPETGEVITLPASRAGELTLVDTGATPLISQEQAMQAVADLGVPWGLGGRWQGKPVTVSAAHGLATFGRPGENGKPWVGDRNILLPNGKRLDHIEDRPMWIIDYGNTIGYGGGCPECPPAIFDHTVYAVDTQTEAVLKIWFYKGESSGPSN